MEKFYVFTGKVSLHSLSNRYKGKGLRFFPFCLSLLISLLLMVSVASSQTWTRSRPVTLAPATTVANYQVKVTLTTALMGNPYASMKNDGSDIRFYDASYTPCSYWIETFNNTGTSIIWVKVANPSGKLWMPMVTAVMRPVCFNRCLLFLISSTLCISCGLLDFGIRKSINAIKAIPPKSARNIYRFPVFSPNCSDSISSDLGSISINET